MIKTSFLNERPELTETYIYNPVEHLRGSFFAKIVNGFQLLTNFAKRNLIEDFRLGSKYVFGLSYGEMNGRYEFTQFHLSTP